MAYLAKMAINCQNRQTVNKNSNKMAKEPFGKWPFPRKWVIPEKIHTPPTDGILEILAGGGVEDSGNPGGRGGLPPWKSSWEGGVLCFRKSRWEGGLKKDPIRRGGVDFFWNNPFIFYLLLLWVLLFMHLFLNNTITCKCDYLCLYRGTLPYDHPIHITTSLKIKIT